MQQYYAEVASVLTAASVCIKANVAIVCLIMHV